MFLKCRMSIPPNPFIANVLEQFNIIPLQLTVNSYIYMVDMYITFWKDGLGEFSVKELVHLYCLKKSQEVIYYLSKSKRIDINGLVRIMNKIGGWDSNYFLFQCEDDAFSRKLVGPYLLRFQVASFITTFFTSYFSFICR